MDPVPLVENKIDDGQRIIDRLEEEGVVVRAAAWLKRVDLDRWSLYIATPLVDEKGTLEAYRRLNPALRSLGDDCPARPSRPGRSFRQAGPSAARISRSI